MSELSSFSTTNDSSPFLLINKKSNDTVISKNITHSRDYFSNKNNLSFPSQSIESDLLFQFNSPITKTDSMNSLIENLNNVSNDFTSTDTIASGALNKIIAINGGVSKSKLSTNIKKNQIQKLLRETREKQQQKLQQNEYKSSSVEQVSQTEDNIIENQVFFFDNSESKSSKTKSQVPLLPPKSKKRNPSLSLDQIDNEVEDLEIGLHNNTLEDLYELTSIQSEITQEFGSFVTSLTQELIGSFQSQATLEYPPSYKSVLSIEDPLFENKNYQSGSTTIQSRYEPQSQFINPLRANALKVLKQEQDLNRRLSVISHSENLPQYGDLMRENPSNHLKTNENVLHNMLEGEKYLDEQNEIKLLRQKGNPRLSVFEVSDNYTSSSDDEFRVATDADKDLVSALQKKTSKTRRRSKKNSITSFIGGIIENKNPASKKKTSIDGRSYTKNKKTVAKSRTSSTTSKTRQNEEAKKTNDEWLLTQFLVDNYSVHGRNYTCDKSNNIQSSDGFRRLSEDMFESSSDEEELASYK
ncbi:hypothetical protein QEN19_000756 [Hanseniaspora menglaensis]